MVGRSLESVCLTEKFFVEPFLAADGSLELGEIEPIVSAMRMMNQKIAFRRTQCTKTPEKSLLPRAERL